MAEVHIERKQGGVPWWAWLLGLLVLGLIVWAIVAATTGDRDQVAVNTTATITPTEATGETATIPAATTLVVIPLETIRTTPAGYLNKPVSGTATVGEVVSDRGFYLVPGNNGDGTGTTSTTDAVGTTPATDNRVFAVLDDSIAENAINVNAGQQVRLEAVAYDPARLGELPVKNLAGDARQRLESEPVFLLVKSISVVDGPASALPIAAILQTPADYNEQQVSGTAHVVRADSDRGFFIEVDGQQMFAVLAKGVDTPDSQVDMNADQTVRLTGTVYDAQRAGEVEELKPVSDETKGLIAQQKAFLRVTNAEVLSRPSS